ncbi:hypothetical protein ACIQF6_35895 [Kitasatospora sp. NPDC092948]|uniref:hypothetical protein n=1 Tax=Kitasatospora sp. NPDC092948 TaxID=3364088 RepID=UPI00382895AC
MIIAVVSVDSALSGRHPVTPRSVLFEAFEYAADPCAFAVDPRRTEDDHADFQGVREQLWLRGPLVLTESQLTVTGEILRAVAADAGPDQSRHGGFGLVARYGDELADHLAADDSRHVCRARA